MEALLRERLPFLTLFMSIPLLLSWQLKGPAEAFQGWPFIALWSWNVVAALTVPVLIGLEIGVCAWLAWRRSSGGPLSLHVAAILLLCVAEAVFLAARSAA